MEIKTIDKTIEEAGELQSKVQIHIKSFLEKNPNIKMVKPEIVWTNPGVPLFRFKMQIVK